MSDIVIKVENLSKHYKLGNIGRGTLIADFNQWFAKIRGKEDPYSIIGHNHHINEENNKEEIWALKDINFEVKQGEVLGIIGKNGAGKSTLLKILSRVTAPSTGSVKVKGRIASLLEVGTGFHPELTGRENVYLNGAILGMTKNDIKNKFDEIIDFSGVERFIDTPVKRYSSGMYVRLAFAVAAHLEPEILIIDEVLAVGDAEFQKKCLGKMKDVSEHGRTVLFVSHNLASVKQLCTKSFLLNNGVLSFSGTVQETIDKYLSGNYKSDVKNKFNKELLEDKDIQLIQAEMMDINGKTREQFDISEDIFIRLTIICFKPVPKSYGYIVVRNLQDEVFIESDTYDYLPNCIENLKVGENIFKIRVNSNVLPFGDYFFYIAFTSSFANNFVVDAPGDVLKFSVVDNQTQRGYSRTSKTSHLLKWEI